MKELTGLSIRTTTYKESKAYQSFYSYTLKNTPFYFKLVWDSNITEEVREQFSNNKIIWDFGDGEIFVGPEAEHYYKWPGKYVVSAKVFDIDGDAHTVYANAVLQVYNPLPDIVTIGGLDNDSVLYPLYAGKKTPPLKIARYNSWQHNDFLIDNNYTVNLHASGSNSSFISVDSYYSSQWGHLKKYYSFVERSLTPDNVVTERLIDTTTTTSVSVYAKKINTGAFNNIWDVRLSFTSSPEPDTVFCGTSGEIATDKSIHFVDQTPSNNTADSIVLLYVSLDTLPIKDADYKTYSYKTDEPYGIVNTVYSTQLLKSIFNSAESLSITSNGITVEGGADVGSLSAQKLYTFDLYPIKYTNTKIPFIITLKDYEGYTTKCYPMLDIYNTENTSKVNLSLVEVFNDGTTRQVSNTYFYTNSTVPVYKESGGYYAGILECYEPITTAAISAVATIKDKPKNLPSKGICFIMQPGLNLFKKIRRIPKYGYFENDVFDVFISAERTTYVNPNSGGVNITYAPMGAIYPLSGNYVWVTDSNRDIIYVFNENGEKVCNDINLQRLRVLSRGNTPTIKTVNVRKNTPNNSASPCNIAINSRGDAWVTIYDCLTSFKIDKDAGIAKAYILPEILNPFYTNLTYSSKVTATSGFAGENLILPTSIDVDRQDNVYISYSHPLKSFVSKYNDSGTLLKTIDFEYPYTAKNILIDGQDNLWVATFNNSPTTAISNPQTQNIIDRTDLLYYFNFKSPEKNFVREFSFLGDITMDSGGSVWVNSENNIVSKITKEGEVSSFIIGNPQSGTDYVQDFGAFAGDLDGNLLLVNNTECVLSYFDAINPKQIKEEKIPYVVLADIDKINEVYFSKSYYKTVGDIAGVRWYIKNKLNENIEERFVSGMSTLFSIKSHTPTIIKKNQNYDISSTFRSYVLQEPLFNNEKLFDGFFGPILNGDDKSVNELGKVVYEKIANFTDNTSDIDKCNISSLNSMYEMVGEKADIFALSVPPGIMRTLDLLSIKKSILFGSVNNFCNNFVLSTFEYSPGSNLGKYLDIEKDYFIPGKPIISYDIFSKKYHLIRSTLIPESDMTPFQPYPLSGVKYNWGWGLVLGSKSDSYKEIKNYYYFYEFIPTKNVELYDGLIDFNDELTTLSSKLSTFEDWTKFGGGMEEVLTSSLYSNLKLLNIKTDPVIPPTPAPTRTPTRTPSKTVPVTVSSSVTPTPSRTPSKTPSRTPTKTPTPSPSRTTSGIPSLTPSPTSTNRSIKPSITPSLTRTPSLTPSNTPSKAISPTPGLSPSLTPSVTPTITQTRTKTPTPSISPTVTISPSITPTITKTPTVTNTPTITHTPTTTPSTSVTPSKNATPSQTPTKTTSISLTPTVTPSVSITPTVTPTVSISPTPGASPSSTPSLTKSPTVTPTITPTNTVTPSITKTPSTTPTPTPSKDIPASPSPTPTPTVTPSSSQYTNGPRIGAIYVLNI